MKRIEPQPGWPESWRESYLYDQSEIYGKISHYGYAYAYDNRRRETLRLLTEVLTPGARVLDIAAAQGNFSLALAELGFDVTWNDLRAELADYVRLKHERGKIEFAAGNGFELTFPSLFDAVLITEIIEHVAHPDDFLAKAAALVRPGGYIVMTTPNGGYCKNRLPKFSDCIDPSVFESAQFKPNADGHIFLLHTDEIEPLAQGAGLVVEKIALFTSPLTAGHVKTEPLLKILPRKIVQIAESVSRHLPWPFKKKALVQMGVRFRKSPASSTSTSSSSPLLVLPRESGGRVSAEPPKPSVGKNIPRTICRPSGRVHLAMRTHRHFAAAFLQILDQLFASL